MLDKDQVHDLDADFHEDDPEDAEEFHPADDGSSPAVLWQALAGLILGMASGPLLADLLLRILVAVFTQGRAIPFGLWSGALAILILIEVALFFLMRRLSDMWAVSFGLGAFFSVLAAVGMMSQQARLLMPDGS